MLSQEEKTMECLKKIPLTVEGESHEIRILHGVHTITVAAFRHNRPENGFRHQLKLSKSADPAEMMDTETIRYLVGLTQKEIIEKRR